jgi:hypothetical protein
VIKIDNELMKYASCSGTTLTFAGGGRGYRGSQAASHASGAVASAGLTYRLDVRDSADANPLKALAVIWADASTATLPAVTAVTVNNGAFVGALIAARTPRVVVLPDNDAAPALTAANFTAAFSGEGRIYVAGFTPRTVFHWKRTGTTYDVKSTTGPGYNAITADAAGMLYWTDDQSAR